MHGSVSGFLAQAIISVLSSAGYAGLAGLMAIESACVPLPSEIVLPFAGYLVSLGRMNLFLVASVGAIGCNIGSEIAYEVGRYGGRPAVDRWGKYLLITSKDMEHADRFFRRFGSIAVLIARMLPVVRTFIAFPAGMSGMHRLRFHLYTFIGSWPWCFLLAYIGMLLGDKWGSDPGLQEVFKYADYIIGVVAVLIIVRFAWARWPTRRA